MAELSSKHVVSRKTDASFLVSGVSGLVWAPVSGGCPSKLSARLFLCPVCGQASLDLGGFGVRGGSADRCPGTVQWKADRQVMGLRHDDRDGCNVTCCGQPVRGSDYEPAAVAEETKS
jgi:hypothetical protein